MLDSDTILKIPTISNPLSNEGKGFVINLAKTMKLRESIIGANLSM